jgi:hypothetical protein
MAKAGASFPFRSLQHVQGSDAYAGSSRLGARSSIATPRKKSTTWLRRVLRGQPEFGVSRSSEEVSPKLEIDEDQTKEIRV